MMSSSKEESCDAKKRKIMESDKNLKDFIAAMDTSDLENAKELIVKCNIKDVSYIHLSKILGFVIKADDADTVKYIIDAYPRMKAESGMSALWEAVTVGALEVASMLIKNGVNLNERRCYTSILRLLVNSQENSKHKLAMLMLECGADPSSQDFKGNTVLHLATHSNSMELIKKLIDKGARIDTVNGKDENVITVAACAENAKFIINGLLANAMQNEVEKKTLIADSLRLQMNREDVNLNAVRALYECGMKIIDFDGDENSLVVEAILGNSKHLTIELLLELGSDLLMCHSDDTYNLNIETYIKRCALGLTKSKSIYEKRNGRNTYLQNTFNSCVTEARIIETVKILDMPLKKVFAMNITLLAWKLRTPSFSDSYKIKKKQILTQFPLYSSHLHDIFARAQVIHENLIEKTDAVTEKLGEHLPDLVLNKILFYMYIGYEE